MRGGRQLNLLVEVKQVGKSYGDNRAVDNLSLAIPTGAVFGLLGPNGAGKTTTISMLSGLFPPDEGDIIIGGFSMSRQPRQAKAMMGVVPQEIALYSTLTARENLRFWGRLYGLGGADLESRVNDVLELVGLTSRARDPINSYSGGMKRRINIAVGLLHRPALLLLDEPTVGVDPQSRRAILDTIKELNALGMTVLYTSHNMDEVSEMCDVIAIMDRGRIIAQGTQAELHRLIEDTDLVRVEVVGALPDVSFLAGMENVSRVDVDGACVDVAVADGNAALPAIITALTDRGVDIATVKIQQPNLETVFLHLTGRTLRD